MDKMSAEEFIVTQPPGTMIYSHALLSDEKEETVFLVSEDQARVDELGQNPVIEIRSALIVDQGTPLVVILMWTGREFYESWLNASRSRDIVTDLKTQQRIVIRFYTAGKVSRQLVTGNPFHEFFSSVEEQAQKRGEVTMDQFNAARDRIWKQYRITDLWFYIHEKGKL